VANFSSLPCSKSGLFEHNKRKSQEKNQSKASACLQQTSGGEEWALKMIYHSKGLGYKGDQVSTHMYYLKVIARTHKIFKALPIALNCKF